MKGFGEAGWRRVQIVVGEAWEKELASAGKKVFEVVDLSFQLPVPGIS